MRRNSNRNYLIGLCSLALLVPGMIAAGMNKEAAPPPIPITVAAPPVPSGIVPTPDDRVIHLAWDGGEPRQARPKPSGISHYEIRYTNVATGERYTSLAPDNRRDLQPVGNGFTYRIEVRSVRQDGIKSAWSPPVDCMPNGDRMRDLRRKCTGFFDDFNDPAFAGLELDPSLWEIGYTLINDPAKTHSFINSQSHAHNMAGGRIWDRDRVINRPNAYITHKDGESVSIHFDMDGAGGGPTARSAWYLDLLPEPYDMYPLLDPFGLSPSFLDRGVSIENRGNSLVIYQIVGAGVKPIVVGRVDRMPGYRRTPNFRQPWRIDVSRSQVTVFVNDRAYLTAPVTIDWERSYPHWRFFSYNPGKVSKPAFLLHWDNFGFTGDPPETVSYQYVTEQRHGDEAASIEDARATLKSPKTYVLRVPDTIQGANRILLRFTLDHKWNSEPGYRLDARQAIVVNGFTIPFNPGQGATTKAQIRQAIDSRSYDIEIPASYLTTGKPGDNWVDFILNDIYVINPKIIVEWDTDKAPPYSNACAAWGNCKPVAALTMPPDCIISDIRAGLTTYPIRLKATDTPPTVGGTLQVTARVFQEGPMEVNGSPVLADRIQLWVDGQPVETRTINEGEGIAEGVYPFAIDTTTLSNGVHRLYVRAITPKGAVSTPAYFESGAKPGAVTGFEAFINVSN